ncbi:spondin domain-containing protein [Cellvibrio sp.]
MNYQWFGLIGIALVLSGCGGSDSKPKNMASSSSSNMSSMMVASSSTAVMSSSSAMASSEMASSSMAAMTERKYSVTVTNLTAGQPFSPLAYSVHYSGFSPFTIGMPATRGIEKIAESGATDDYINEAMANPDVILVDHAMGLTLPGESKIVSLNVSVEMANADQLLFSLVNMLGNTNDAFAGVNSVAIGKLAVGENLTLNAQSYDAGTEMNTETQATIPGPAGGGEGFSAVRDDMVDQVTMHPGAVTRDDGKMDSTLTQVHRWDNPTARITITRLAP